MSILNGTDVMLIGITGNKLTIYRVDIHGISYRTQARNKPLFIKNRIETIYHAWK